MADSMMHTVWWSRQIHHEKYDLKKKNFKSAKLKVPGVGFDVIPSEDTQTY